MKRILFFILITMGTFLCSLKCFGQAPSAAGPIIEHAAILDSLKASPLADSAKVTFSKVYEDVKTGMAGLAAGLKVGVSHVYEVLVKQQLVMAITYCLWLPFGIGLIFLFIKAYRHLDANDRFDEPGRALFLIFGGILSMVPLVIFMCNMDTIVTGFVNPEYGAIRDIINFVK